MSNSFKIRPTHFSWGGRKVFSGRLRAPGYGPVEFYTHRQVDVETEFGVVSLDSVGLSILASIT